MVEKHRRWLEQREGRCAAGICPNRPVGEVNGKGYCRRCMRSAKIRAAQLAYHRLAAAAPALLAACEELLALVTRAQLDAVSPTARAAAIEQARAAIAKAKGERA